MHVVSQVAQSLARAIASSRPLEAVTGKTPESADVQASLGTGKGALGMKEQLRSLTHYKGSLRSDIGSWPMISKGYKTLQSD